MFSFIEFKVRLTGRNEKHTGMLGAYEFNQGVSTRKLHRREAEMLPAIGFPCIAIDDEGNDVFVVEVGKIPAPDSSLEEMRNNMPKLKRKTENQPVVKQTKKIKEEKTIKPELNLVKPTKEELEAIADKEGLRGLRAIAEQFDVKGKSIAELIEKILKV